MQDAVDHYYCVNVAGGPHEPSRDFGIPSKGGMTKIHVKLKAMKGVDRDANRKLMKHITSPLMLRSRPPLARPGTFETDNLLCTLPCLARRGTMDFGS
jgi:hypothetical protein